LEVSLLNVLFINQFYWPDTAATGQLLYDVTIGVDNATVICGTPQYGVIDDAGLAPKAVIRRSKQFTFSHGALGRLASYASFYAGAIINGFRTKPKPDVIVTMTTPPLLSVLGEVLRRIRKSKHYIWEMDVYPDIAISLGVMKPSSITTRLIGSLADWSRRNADGIIALGEDMKHRLIARGIPAEKIHIAENWADGNEIQPLPFPEPSPLVIHYSGNLGLSHDVDTIASAIQALQNDPRYHFIFAGGGPRRSQLMPSPNVDFQPFTPRAELSRNLAQGHIGLVTMLPAALGAVVPSKTYGIMAAGRPILFIGPRECQTSRIIQKHNCGWQIDPGDVDSLLALLHHLRENPAELSQAGLQARKAFEAHYDRPIGVARILDIIGANPLI
jgi:colanic acid biosynthesis glycosyl transferase WcaI